jgi:hypothetical protein
MVEIPKVVHVLSCGFLLSLGLLCNVARAESMAPGAEEKAGHSQRTYGQGDKELSYDSKESTSSRATCCAWKAIPISLRN